MYEKTKTCLTGLKVHKNPAYALSNLYYILQGILHKFPDESAYKHHTLNIICKRSTILEQNKKNMCEVEKKINCGQIEEVIFQAKREISLARKMLQWKSWEPLVDQPPKDQWTWPPVRS